MTDKVKIYQEPSGSSDNKTTNKQAKTLYLKESKANDN